MLRTIHIFKMNKNKLNTNPNQRIKMLIRRIRTQKRIITSLEERNYQLVTELNDTKVALANTTNEYNKLMSKNYEQAVHLNHNQDERVKLKATMDKVDIETISALKYLGSASEVLLNLQKIISHIKSEVSDYTPKRTIVLPSPPCSSRNEVSLSDSVEVKRNQAAVSPMVKGYVISNPTITLERLRLSDIGGELEPGKSVDTRGELSPIPEESAESEPIRTRLGRRGQLPQQFTGRAASKLSDFIPEAHAEPVVRLSDVSRLLSNTSWLNYTPPNDPSPSTSSEPSVSGINVFPADTVTVRERKKGRRANKVSCIDKIGSSSGSSNNIKVIDPKSCLMDAENNEDKSSECKKTKVESLEPENNEEITIRSVNSGILLEKSESSESSESRNSTLRSFTEINGVNSSKYKNSGKPSNKEIAESSFSINDEGTSSKRSSFEESKFTINASVTVNEIEESMGRETIIQPDKNSNEENFSKCKNSIVCSDAGGTSKYDLNVLTDNGNDKKICICNIEASAEKMKENANNYNIEVAMNKFTNSKKLEDTGNPDVAPSITADKEETFNEKSSESRGTFLLAKEIDSDSSRTFIVRDSNAPVSQEDSIVTNSNAPIRQEDSIVTNSNAPVTQEGSIVTNSNVPDSQEDSIVRNSNAPVSQEDAVINYTRVLPELGSTTTTSNETQKENTVIEQSSMKPTTSVKSPLLVREQKNRPRSSRIKKPSIKVLEAISGNINEGSLQVKKKMARANRFSQKNSKCVVASDAKSTTSPDSEPLEGGCSFKRTSSRMKKTVVYRDEPFTKEEMKKILRKGLQKPH